MRVWIQGDAIKKQSAPYRNRARGPALVLELPAAVAARLAAQDTPAEKPAPAVATPAPVQEMYDLRSLPEVKRRLNLKFVRLEGAVMVYEIKD